ncbi:hypothetical protein QYF61_017277, partial [Mycteria americana]
MDHPTNSLSTEQSTHQIPFYTEHDAIWYGIALWSVGVSCPSRVPSQLLVQPQPPRWWGGVKLLLWSKKARVSYMERNREGRKGERQLEQHIHMHHPPSVTALESTGPCDYTMGLKHDCGCAYPGKSNLIVLTAWDVLQFLQHTYKYDQISIPLFSAPTVFSSALPPNCTPGAAPGSLSPSPVLRSHLDPLPDPFQDFWGEMKTRVRVFTCTGIKAGRRSSTSDHSVVIKEGKRNLPAAYLSQEMKRLPQKLAVIVQKLFQGSAVLTLSSTEVIALPLESCGCVVTSPVSLCFQEHSPAEEQLFQTTEVGTSNHSLRSECDAYNGYVH